MTTHWIKPDALFDGRDLHQGMGLHIEDGHVVEVGRPPDDAKTIRGLITVGFVDVQVNGGGGVLLNTTPTAQGLRDIRAAHLAQGTVAILPTVITDTPEVLQAATQAVLATKGEDGLIGLHIEGPHIAQAKRGTHAQSFIRPFDEKTNTCVAHLRRAGIPVMITVAPEAITLEQIAALDGIGAVVSLGHTNADEGAIKAALDAGARAGTHLFNAMSQMSGRAPGAVGALIQSDAYVGIICDGHHVSDTMIALALRARPRPDLMMLVSDAMATVGGPDEFDLYGQTIKVQDGRLINAEGNLAGAHVTQVQGVQRLVNVVGTDLQSALRMAITTPAACMGRPDLAQIKGRPVGDLMHLSANLDLIGPLGV